MSTNTLGTTGASWEEEPLDDEMADDEATSGTAKEPRPCFGDVVDFVHRYLAPTTETRLGGPVVWCSRWWEHPAAVLRLSSLWRAWETMRLQSGGMSAWWVGHYDPHMRVLLDAERGPFHRCHKGHNPASGLRIEVPPPKWQDTPVTTS